MKQRIFLAVTILILAMAVSAAGADIAGKWVAEQQGPQGTTQTIFNFTVNGNTLTGTVSNRAGDSEISEGKIEGDDISFVVVRTMGEMEMKTLHRGKVSGDEIKFTIERQGGGTGGGRMGGPGGPGGGGMGGPGGGPGGGGMGGPGGGPGGGMGGPGGGAGRGQGGPQELVAKRAK